MGIWEWAGPCGWCGRGWCGWALANEYYNCKYDCYYNYYNYYNCDYYDDDYYYYYSY